MKNEKIRRSCFATKISKFRQESVVGWLTKSDSQIIANLLQLQNSHGLNGDVLEIGVYKGKSVPILASNLTSGEKLVLCDLFDTKTSHHLNLTEIDLSYEATSVSEITNLLLRFPNISATIIVGDSLNLGPLLIDSTFRFIHVDGSHIYEIVKKDIDLALKHLDPVGGILAIDDYRSIHTPGVSRAVWELHAEGKVRIILRSLAKIYVVKNTFELTNEIIADYFSKTKLKNALIDREDVEGLIINDGSGDIYKLPIIERLLLRVVQFMWKSVVKSKVVPRNVNIVEN